MPFYIGYTPGNLKHMKLYSKTANHRTGGANNEYRGGPGGPGCGLGGPGGGFSGNRSSGKPLLLLRLKNHPQDHQNHYQDHRTTPVLVISLPCTIIDRLRVYRE